MTVQFALATYGDGTQFDQFTCRCRLPMDIIRSKPRNASQYMLYNTSKKTVAICRAALDRSSSNNNTNDVKRSDGEYACDASVTISHDSCVYKRTALGDVANLQWIPQTSIRNATSVVLNFDDAAQLANPMEIDDWLRDVDYRQLLQDTFQRHFLVTVDAVVRLPCPIMAEDGYLQFQVTSVYPETNFACVTPQTRVTFRRDNNIPSSDQRLIDTDLNAEYERDKYPTKTTFDDGKIGGLDKERAALREMIIMPVTNGNLIDMYGIEFPKGLLLCGPPGVGKTLLVRTVVEECQKEVPLMLKIINGADIMTSGIGDAENTLREIFREVAEHVKISGGASIVFIDELDALCPKRDAGGAIAHSRIVAQLLTLLDGVEKHKRENVIVVGATNLPNAIDPALRRPGRFDRELFVSPPDTITRKQIFRVHMHALPYCVNESVGKKEAFLDALAEKSIGYVGADIAALCREALAIASTRQFLSLAQDQQLNDWWEKWKLSGRALHKMNFADIVSGNAWRANPVAIPVWFLAKKDSQTDVKSPDYFPYLLDGASTSNGSDKQYSPTLHTNSFDQNVSCFEVTMADFDQAMQVVLASTLRGSSGLTKHFDRFSWDSIGGQQETKLALQQALEWPLKFPETFARLGVKPPRGILLYGPPGCSKSSIVRAAAHSSGTTFLTLSAAKVFSPFFGDAEASVRQVFRDARAALPAIIFFDEIEVLVAKRDFDGSGGQSGSNTAMRVLSTLLNEMDGVESAEGLLVIGATNRPDCIDAALMRPGRFDRILFVGLPTEQDRVQILQIHSKSMQLDDDVDLLAIAAQAHFFSGAELENVCREAALLALRDSIHAQKVSMRHFLEALRGTSPISSEASLRQYLHFAEEMGHIS